MIKKICGTFRSPSSCARELLPRVRTALRHTAHTPELQVVSFDDISVDFKKMELKRDGKPLVLIAQEFKTLQFLVQNADRVVGRPNCRTKCGATKTILRRVRWTITSQTAAKAREGPVEPRTFPHGTQHGIQVCSLILVRRV